MLNHVKSVKSPGFPHPKKWSKTFQCCRKGAIAVLLRRPAMQPVERAPGARTYWTPVVEVLAVIFPRASIHWIPWGSPSTWKKWWVFHGDFIRGFEINHGKMLIFLHLNHLGGKFTRKYGNITGMSWDLENS